MLLALAGAAASLQIVTADITVDVGADSALVEAHYTVRNTAFAPDVTIIRLRDQDVRLLDPVRGESRTGLLLVSGVTSLRYVVTGRLDRVPLPVPDVALEPTRGSVRIHVRGLERHVRLNEAFPRLTGEAGSAALAELGHVPSFLRLPPAAGAWSVYTASQMFVIALVVASSIAWAARLSRRHNATR